MADGKITVKLVLDSAEFEAALDRAIERMQSKWAKELAEGFLVGAGSIDMSKFVDVKVHSTPIQ